MPPANPSGAPAASVTVSVSVTGPGKVVYGSSECRGSCRFTMPAGTAVHLAAAADGQASFRGWSGACNGTGGCDLTPNADISVAAAFDPPAVAPPPPGKTTWLLTVTLHGSGSVKSDPAGIDCPNRCAARFDDQALVHLTANPAPGFTLGASVGAVRM